VAILGLSGGDVAEREALRRAARPVVASLNDFADFLEQELIPRADGEWRIGREKFLKKFALVTDAGVTADETLAAAEAERERVVRELYDLARQSWYRYFPNQSPPPDDEPGRRETISRVLNAIEREHGTPDALVADAGLTVDGLKEFIRRRDVLRLPEPDRCLVLEMPEFRRGNSGAYLDAALPLDPQGVSIYAISPPPSDWSEPQRESFLEEYNRHMLQILSIHEAYPGHYVQLEYANRSPSLVRRVLQSGVYAEGWAVYTEQMMLDEGYGDGDPALRMSQLKFYLRTVVNTILDHRMHCTQMTDDEAFKLLTEGAFQSEGEARLKIIRAKQSSVQLSTYFVGRQAFYNLRQQLQRELGDRFVLGRYHEAVLSSGSVPVKFLPEFVRRTMQNP
jgi:NAD(P)-dependent dehydrogenase (short-subunit alcohol dehydrogenase family)